MYDSGTNPSAGGDGGTNSLTRQVDAEKVRALATYTQHEGLTPDIHALVLSGDAANQGRNSGIDLVPFRDLPQYTLYLLGHGLPSCVTRANYNLRSLISWIA